MSTPGYRAGESAAKNGQDKPHSHDYTTRVEIANGWNAGGGK